MALHGELWVGRDPGAVAEEAARRFVALARDATATRPRFTVALGGGATPKALFERLAAPPCANQVDWPKVEVFFGDDRTVSADHPDSNYGMAQRALLSRVPVDPAHIHRIEGERSDAAERYERTLKAAFGAGSLPQFDLILLGLGIDGHTASLFPHTPALDERVRLVARNPIEKLHTDRITLTIPALNAARNILIVANGAEKAAIVGELASEKEDPRAHPILFVRPTSGTLGWLLDRAAAAEISRAA